MRLLFCALFLSFTAFSQRDNGPQPTAIDPGSATKAPSDAIVLFDGNDMSHWVTIDGKPAGCIVADGVMNCKSGAGSIYTTAKIGSMQLHLEFAVPYMPEQHGQLRGNSGVLLQSRSEIQVLDSYNNPTYANGSLGALYGEYAPLVNAARPPTEWETYDIIFHQPQCDAEGKVARKGTVTVILNGVLVQDHVTINKTDQGCGAAPLMLQDHSGFKGAPVTTMRFRNIWYRPLEDEK
jgi:hypothetical protein